MKYVLFIFATLLFLKESSGIYGGCMSYYTQPSDKPGHVKVEIDFLNGWKLYKGPCYNCTERDEGHDVTARRKMYIQDYSNPEAFGSYGFEPEVVNANVKPTNITMEVNNNVRDVVLMVNSHEQWEMESSKITLDVNISTTYSNKFDITFQSEPDVPMTKIPNLSTMFLQVKVDSNIRRDTNAPNNSPIVLVKPYYSLELGKDYFLHIPIIDNDSDQFQCALSIYLEAESFSSFLHKLKKANALSINKDTCILTLRIISSVFRIGDSFGIPITVKDYTSTDTIVGTSNHFAYNMLLGRVSVLMYYSVTGDTHPPEFVTPTPPNNQKYTIYVGGDFRVNVYAKPTLNSRTITKFNFLRRDGKPVNQTRNVASWDQKVAYISMSWSPVDEDKGHHIVCANAEDSTGVSTVELHCFRIEVKENIFRPNNKIQGKPYYASFPEPADVVCPLHTYCRFPVYAATTNSGHNVNKIVSTSESEENVTIEYSHAMINGSLPTTVAQVEFLALLPGHRQICLNASDNIEWTTRCLYVTVQRPDPCSSLPCQHGGLCSPSSDNSEFQCHCVKPFTGQFCENDIMWIAVTAVVGCIVTFGERYQDACVVQRRQFGGEKPKGMQDDGVCTTTMGQMFPGCSFSSKTPQMESVIGCKKGNPCHFYMYAETNGSCPSLITHDEHTGIYTPELNTGLCRYEIVYTNTSACGSNTVCFMLCANGESRCYKVQTNDITDKCSPNPCVNNAYCQTTIMGHLKCHCQQGNWGKYCENSFCTRHSHCQNDAVCFRNFNETNCLCRPGYVGSTCAQKVFQNITHGMEKDGHFTMFNRLEKMTCYINGQCTVPFSIINNGNYRPKVEVGFYDKTLEVQSIILEKSRYLGGITNGILTVVGRELGNKMICLDLFEASRNERIKDELCFKINVNEGNIDSNVSLFPYFVRPTLPHSSVLQCVVKDRCYLNLWAKSALGMYKCPLLQTDKTIEDGVYIFPLKDSVHQPCQYDVSIIRDNATDLQLCFTLLNDLEQYVMFKDRRCYLIKFVHGLTGKGTCAGKFCYNGGFCDGSSSTFKCLCRIGFSGINCSESHGRVLDTDVPSYEQSFFGDLAFPKSVYCKYDTECVVLFSVSHSSGFHTGWHGTNIEVINIRYEKIPSSLDVIGKVVLIHKSTGIDLFCIILSSTNRTSADVKCCSIFMESGHPKAFPDYGQARFIWSSPSNGTVFTCSFGQPCHVLITLSKEYNNANCPVLKDRTSDGISTHIFVSNFTSKCRYDVWIGSPLSDNTKTKDYCFQSPNFGALAEIRCFKVYFDQHAQKEATATTTPSSIGSTASTSHSGLMCPKCDADLNCVWNGTCYPGQVCMIRSFNGATVVHCSEKENCNFIKAAVPHVEILCCEDHQCITNIIP
ncbi:uncharacterized protein LOC128175596 [Crassostrea angulata]|uniref:uncharacterized protein LOC128175596 n=1 Tax=Magallana angulata TaxID=2784310 RepID=UPI0022B1339D|nr:uncharacterized protein LOC128175596 [Crassostrea angulata]